MAREGKPLNGSPWDEGLDYNDINGSIKAQTEALEKLLEHSANLPDDELVGYVYSESVADGSAYYIVSSVKPLILRHIDYLDGYRILPHAMRGITEKYLRQNKNLSKRFAAMFK